jgi:hypothetical protein
MKSRIPIKLNSLDVPSKSRWHSRAGILFTELFVALLLLGTLVSVLVPLIRNVETARRTTELRRIANLELSNLMEELAARPATQLADEVQKLQLSDVAKSKLPNAQLKTSSTAADDAKGIIKVQLALTWLSATGQFVEPVRLTAWLGGPQR